MRRWDSVVDGYTAVCEARGLSGETLRAIRDELDRLGCWPKPGIRDGGPRLTEKGLRLRAGQPLDACHSRARGAAPGSGVFSPELPAAGAADLAGQRRDSSAGPGLAQGAGWLNRKRH